MKRFCDYCEEDVVNPCSTITDAINCDSYKGFKDDSTISKKIDYSDKQENIVSVSLEPKGYHGRSEDEEVDHPVHYNRGKIEVKDFISDQGLDPKLSNAVKYICRAGFKSEEKWQQDLEKAIWYIQDFIELVNETGEFPYMATKKVPTNKKKSSGPN